MSRNTPKQTPFDDLVPRPGSSASTPPSPPPANNTLPLTGRTNAPATRVVAALQDDEPDDDSYNATAGSSYVSPPRRRIRRRMLPTGTLVGLAMVGGAFIVLALSALFKHVVPRAQTRSLPPPLSTGPRIAEAPAEDSQGLTPQEEADAARRAQADELNSRRDRTTEESSSSSSGVIVDNNSGFASPDEETTNEPVTHDSEDASGTASSREERRTESESRDEGDEPDTDRDRNATSTNSSGSNRFEHDRTGYRIKPPSGFSLQKTGRRTVWRGPRGSQLLVETSGSPGASPRADWEQLDKALSKKYGSRYRSLGIRETTLAGRPAAVWEFEIGDTRKVDVAVHHKGTGYAVLAEAPSEEFENMRPQLESAIRSFELPSKSTRRRVRRSSKPRKEPASESRDEDNDDGNKGY